MLPGFHLPPSMQGCGHLAGDEDRIGTILMNQTEVLPDPLGHQDSAR